jgi:hypothetical protein
MGSAGGNQRGRPMTHLYDGYDIESFEAGRGLWHARIRRADQLPVVINGCPFPKVEVGFAWSDEDAAVAHAKQHIDRCKHRWAAPAQASI